MDLLDRLLGFFGGISILFFGAVVAFSQSFEAWANTPGWLLHFIVVLTLVTSGLRGINRAFD